MAAITEPSAEDFEAAEHEEPRPGPASIVFRALRIVLVMVVIAAMLVYFATPLNNIFRAVPYYHWLHPDSGTRTIPLAPHDAPSPKIAS